QRIYDRFETKKIFTYSSGRFLGVLEFRSQLTSSRFENGVEVFVDLVPYFMCVFATQHTRKNAIREGGEKPSEECLVFE
ncbi:hypothetical protein A2U01_0059318, partial [Trifolium medium]|nr:hypothetical protein [Trifolium medium]